MYWTFFFDTDSGILRADLDGSNLEKVVSTGLDAAFGIALDLSRRKIYWSHGNRISRVNLDGSNVEDLVTTGLRQAVGLALHRRARKMYWADRAAKKIQRSNLDGSNVEDLVTTGLMDPWDVALDLGSAMIYWTDGGTHKIQRANLDGSNIRGVVTGLETPSGIALDVPAPIPTISAWGVAAMGILLLALGSIVITRRAQSQKNSAYGRRGEKGPASRVDLPMVGISLFSVLIGVATTAVGEPATIPSETVLVSVDSGVVLGSGPGSNPVVVFSQVVSVSGAPWMRLHFQLVQLSGFPGEGE